MALTIHDPGRIGLRRGIRAAIAMPVVLAITLFVLDDQKGAVYAGFGTAGLLITADYAGSWQRRLTSYLVTGVIGTVVLVIGLAASTSTALAVATTALVAFLLAFISLLRGLMAVGSPAVLLVFIVAVTLGGDELQMAADVTAWWVAVIVSTVAALVILPHDVRTDIRDALAAALDAAADVAQSAWLGVGPTSEYQAKVDPINFYKTDPVADLGNPATGRPVVRQIRIRDMMTASNYRRAQRSSLHLHRQFVMPNGKRYFYDFYHISFGPIALPARLRLGERLTTIFGNDGRYRPEQLKRRNASMAEAE